ncbi:Prefoldin, subunit 4 [Metschnikowia bicuspidata var. bicuspidata NRRL YB-4993]|uniref:Prefoldin subunit 4 n=1 Tax=Metschnikowia bicuspidata var. bicuspidata NRRL YB-4993 TaxID=869754 RepID=A0A1A0HCY1_9ASCO|nr:Prefoldin, subunit 4 [Metschnikowia bicuspidata var. bicuspidata NRRL YB-4993]OBA21788.1 Prefoldin, subunit 4 [Metschnikowia bicuspidata var. bicuspidata NRRL YB-4993]
MELLPQGQANTTEVLWEDQQKINEFSSLINKKDTLADQLDTYKNEKEYIDDLAMEIELLDDEEKIQYKIADAFVFVSVTKAVEMIEKENELLDSKISLISDRIDDIDSQLSMLKAHLYGKFGKSINLERD